MAPGQRLVMCAAETPQKGVSGKMGQNQCRAQPFISLTQKFSVKSEAKVTRQQLCSYLELICEYNPWSPGEGTLETEFENFTQKNGEKVGRIEDIHVSF